MLMTALLLFAVVLYGDAVSIEEQIANAPEVPNFAEYAPEIPRFARRLMVASPCIGIHGSGYAFDVLGAHPPTPKYYLLDISHDIINHLRPDTAPSVNDPHIPLSCLAGAQAHHSPPRVYE